MMHTLVKRIGAAICLLSVASSVSANSEQALKLEGSAYLIINEVNDQGIPLVKLVAPEPVVPGDRLLFATSYENRSGRAVTNFVVTNPIPDSVQLSPDPNPGLIVSVDGGATWGVLRDLSVPDGKGSSRAASASDVTHLRRIIAEIAPNAIGQVEYVASVR